MNTPEPHFGQDLFLRWILAPVIVYKLDCFLPAFFALPPAGFFAAGFVGAAMVCVPQFLLFFIFSFFTFY